jgi:hypothetical protein
MWLVLRLFLTQVVVGVVRIHQMLVMLGLVVLVVQEL